MAEIICSPPMLLPDGRQMRQTLILAQCVADLPPTLPSIHPGWQRKSVHFQSISSGGFSALVTDEEQTMPTDPVPDHIL